GRDGIRVRAPVNVWIGVVCRGEIEAVFPVGVAADAKAADFADRVVRLLERQAVLVQGKRGAARAGLVVGVTPQGRQCSRPAVAPLVVKRRRQPPDEEFVDEKSGNGLHAHGDFLLALPCPCPCSCPITTPAGTGRGMGTGIQAARWPRMAVGHGYSRTLVN